MNDEYGELTPLGKIYHYVNYFLLTFFMVEIASKLFAYGYVFLSETINVFDSLVVFISYFFIVSGKKVQFVMLLRILRLIKFMTEMKKIADARKAKQEEVKKKKKQSSQMASNVERVIDFLER